MPELPDVETFRRYVNATSLHQKIDMIDVRSQQVVGGAAVEELREELVGRTFESTGRHGKYLFARLDDGRALALHFGMTGSLKYFKDMEKDPAYDRLLIGFANGYHLAYESLRKLGEVHLIDDVDRFVQRRHLGPDALDPGFDLAAFRSAFGDRRIMAKAGLMDQETVAGIGNVYSDEILFQAGIYPRRRMNTLDQREIEGLYRAMKDVLQTAIEHQADPEQFPHDYIIPHRSGDGKCPLCGEGLERVKASGRTAYYCPNRQDGP